MRLRLLRPVLFAALLALAPAAPLAQPAGFSSDRLTVVTRGQGPDVILIPGLVSHRDVWSKVADTLDDRYRLHLVQVNGFAGLPARANADGPVSAPVAEEIARYIRESKLSAPAVIGHSMGGTIGMMLAARHPSAVGRLMLVDIVPNIGALFGPPGTTTEAVRAMADQMRAKTLAETPGSPTGTIEMMMPPMTRVEAMKPVLLQYVKDSDRRTAANAFHELMVTDLGPELGRITVPMTVLYVIPPQVTGPAEEFDARLREMYSNVPRATFVRIPDSNHFIQYDQPERFIKEVDAFMGR